MSTPTVVLRKQALAQGLKIYYTGLPCSRGHITYRTSCNGCCQDCSRLRNRFFKDGRPKSAAKKTVVAKKSKTSSRPRTTTPPVDSPCPTAIACTATPDSVDTLAHNMDIPVFIEAGQNKNAAVANSVADSVADPAVSAPITATGTATRPTVFTPEEWDVQRQLVGIGVAYVPDQYLRAISFLWGNATLRDNALVGHGTLLEAA